MLVMVDFGVERVLIAANDMTQALLAAWKDMIRNNDENPERAVESFLEDIPTPSEELLRAHIKSCRNFGYRWTELAIKDTQELTDDQYETLRTISKYRVVNY